jgi:hypothetical protein
VAQVGSPWSLQIYARALLKQPGMTLRALPGGTLKLDRRDGIDVQGKTGPLHVTRYELSGIQESPDTMLLDDNGNLFGVIAPDTVVVREGYEGEEVRLRKLAAEWSTARFAAIQKEVAHDYDAPTRIRNVRLFDPNTSALTAPLSVLVNGRKIAAVNAPSAMPLSVRCTTSQDMPTNCVEVPDAEKICARNHRRYAATLNAARGPIGSLGSVIDLQSTTATQRCPEGLLAATRVIDRISEFSHCIIGR